VSLCLSVGWSGRPVVAFVSSPVPSSPASWTHDGLPVFLLLFLIFSLDVRRARHLLRLLLLAVLVALFLCLSFFASLISRLSSSLSFLPLSAPESHLLLFLLSSSSRRLSWSRCLSVGVLEWLGRLVSFCLRLVVYLARASLRFSVSVCVLDWLETLLVVPVVLLLVTRCLLSLSLSPWHSCTGCQSHRLSSSCRLVASAGRVAASVCVIMCLVSVCNGSQSRGLSVPAFLHAL